jgi:ABC-type Zn uptake system ZnuABC Zn-binding protein ZnuA
MKTAWVGVVLAGVVATAGCQSDASGTAPSGRLRIVTTVSPITNIVQNIVGDRADVTGIVPEGVNSHEFEPAPSDGRVLADADVIFINGLHLEEPTRKLAEKVAPKGTPLVLLGERTISPEQYAYDFSFPKEDGDPNPHLWTDPELGLRYAEIVRDELVRLDGANAAAYRANADRLIAQIRAFSAALETASSTVPERKLVTYHDAYAYFARRYGWTVIGAIQPSDFAEPRPRDVAAIIDQVKREQVQAIFGSEVFPSPVLAQIAKESGARYVDELRDDDLPGTKGDPDHSYLGLLKFDYVTMVEALGGDARALKALDVSNAAADTTAEYRY